ncbi:MAG: family 20 glycosylhydrolase [Bacteroidales bacterium]|nr:family 20 glycosylhydrolase [Bacteroidales bacterium]
MKKVAITVLSLCLCLTLSAVEVQDRNMGIIPAPESIVAGEGEFVVSSSERLVMKYNCPQARENAEILAGRLNDLLDLKVVFTSGRVSQKTASISFELDDSFAEEAYSLAVTCSGIVIKGRGAGMFYAVQSLLQMVELNDGGYLSIPSVTIKDSPRFAYRGIMQDVGYHIYPVEFIKQEIDWLSRYKMNVYHWHLTEDHGWRIESRKYPRLNEISSWRDQTCICNYDHEFEGMDGTPYGGYYTQEQIREIVEYAAERHVTVIPEIELPGHTLAVLAAYPELACGDNPGPFKVAQNWGIYQDVFCAGKEETFKFLEGVLDEVMELFPSHYIHIGGDECPKDRWRECKYCQQRIAQEGLKNEEELQSWFIRRIEAYLNSKGRDIIGWDEILEGGIAPNATVMNWRDISEGVKAAKSHHKVVMSPNAHIYFDYIQGDRKQEPMAIGWGYNPSERVYDFEPVPQELSAEEAEYVIGVEAPLWTEHMDTYRKVSYMLFPRLFALSEVAWSKTENKDADNFFNERFPRHLGHLDGTGILYRVPVPGGIKEELLRGGEFTLEMTCPVEGAHIYYNFDGQEPRETDYLYEGPVRIHVPRGEMREVKAVVITPSGRRSNTVRTIYDNRFGTEYMVGSSTSSLEPDLSIFSTTLAGYGAPGEGRFSLDWEKVGRACDAVWTSTIEGTQFDGTAGSDAVIKSSAIYGNRVFALTQAGTLWRKDLESKDARWEKIGYNNGTTYRIDVERIVVKDGRLYAIDSKGDLYVNFHRTNRNLTARAAAFSHEGNTAVIVGLDLTGFDYAFINSVKADISSRTGLPAEAVLINASHTHFAPVSQGWYAWPEQCQYPDEEYMEKIVRPAIVSAVEGALADLHPGYLFFGRTKSFIGGNRCLEWPENIYDPTADFIEVVNACGKVENVIFLAGCHPVFNNWGEEGFTINANFPAVAKEMIQHATGADNAIFLQGCGGDVNPLYGSFREMGSILAGDILECINGKLQTVDGGISYALDSVMFRTHPWKKSDILKFRSENAKHVGDLECEKNVRWADIMLNRIKNGTMPEYMPVYVQTINVGDWKLVALSREAVTSYGIMIRDLWPNRNVSVIGYTNDVSSYLPSLEHIRAHTYEGDNSFFWYSQPNVFPEDVQETILETIRKNNR